MPCVNNMARKIFVHGIKLRYYGYQYFHNRSWLLSCFFPICFQLDWPTAHYRFQGRLELSVDLHRTSGSNVKFSVSLRYHVRIQWAICASSLISFFSLDVSAWTYSSGGCFVPWGSKAWSLTTRVAVTLMRFIDHSKVLSQCFVLLRVSIVGGLLCSLWSLCIIRHFLRSSFCSILQLLSLLLDTKYRMKCRCNAQSF